MTVIGIYLPNGNSGGEAGFAYKLAWMDRLAERAEALLEADTPFVIAGDFNVCPTDDDLAPGSLSPTDALVHPESRAALPPPALGRPDRRGARGAPAWRGLHVLGLPGRRLAARHRPAHRPRAAVARAGRTAGRRGARPRGARRSRSRRITCRWWSSCTDFSPSGPGSRRSDSRSTASVRRSTRRDAAGRRPSARRTRRSDSRSSASGPAPSSSRPAAAAPARNAAPARAHRGAAWRGCAAAVPMPRPSRSGPSGDQSLHQVKLLERHAGPGLLRIPVTAPDRIATRHTGTTRRK